MKLTSQQVKELVAKGVIIDRPVKLPKEGKKEPLPFRIWCSAFGVPEPTEEFQFAAPRRWRFDWAWPEKMVALEIEGGIWTNGRHTRGSGFIADIEKYNKAVVLGWRIIRCTPQDMEDGSVFKWLKEILA